MKTDTFFYDAFWWVVGTVTTAVAIAATWITRNILTNRKQIELLEQSNEHSRELRARQDDDIKQIREDQAKILQHLLCKK